MKKELREKAIQLRLKKQMSYSAIRKELGVSKSTLSYWLRDLPLSEEKIIALRKASWQKGEAARERYRNTMQRKREDASRNVYEEECRRLTKMSSDSHYIAGLMLYAAEGEKKNRYRIALANTDLRIVCFFQKWMNVFLDIKYEDMRAQLHLYENMDIKKEEQFWLKILNFKRNQLYKTQIRPLRPGSFTYTGGFGHGTCSLEYSKGPKKTKLLMAIKAFLDLHS